jgi:hypothetical protein
LNQPVDSTLGWRCAGISPWPTVTTNPSGTTPSAWSTLTSRAVLHLEAQHGPAEISWSDRPKDGGKGTGTAKITPEPGKASLTGTLTLATSGAPAAGGWVEGCGNLAFADDNGIVHMDIVATPCSVIAMRQHGALRPLVLGVEREGQRLDLTFVRAPIPG